MNRTLAIITLLTLAGAAFAQVSRPITQVNDVTALDPYAEAMEFWQGDTVQYDVYARDGSAAMVLTGDVFAVWMVSARTNYGTVYLASTGTVITATNGHVRINATRAQTLLPATNYWSQVRLFKVVASATQELSVAAWNLLAVHESIDVAASEYVTPGTSAWTFIVNITNSYVDIVGGSITNIVGGTNVTVRSGAGPQVTVDFDRTGIATGTPLYAYSETDPVYNAATGAIWDAINGKQDSGSYATGAQAAANSIGLQLTNELRISHQAYIIPITGTTAAVLSTYPQHLRLNATGATCSIEINNPSAWTNSATFRLSVPYTTTVVSWATSSFYATGFNSSTNVTWATSANEAATFFCSREDGSTGALWRIYQATK